MNRQSNPVPAFDIGASPTSRCVQPAGMHTQGDAGSDRNASRALSAEGSTARGGRIRTDATVIALRLANRDARTDPARNPHGGRRDLMARSSAKLPTTLPSAVYKLCSGNDPTRRDRSSSCCTRTQSADELCRGTQMNRMAEDRFLVVLPTSRHPRERLQVRTVKGRTSAGRGEAFAHCGTRKIVARSRSIRVEYMGGTAAGAACRHLGETYPELYAASAPLRAAYAAARHAVASLPCRWAWGLVTATMPG